MGNAATQVTIQVAHMAMTTDRARALQDRFVSASVPTESQFNALRVALRDVLVRCVEVVSARQSSAWEWQRFCDMSAGDKPEQAASWEWFLRPAVSERVVTDIAREVLETKCEGLVAAIDAGERLRVLFLMTSSESSQHANILMNTLVSTFVRRAIERFGPRGGWSEAAFETVFGELVDYIEADSDVFMCSSPLQRFAMDSNYVEIRPDLWIEQLTWDERRKRLQDASILGSMVGTFTPMWTAQERFALRLRVRLPRIRADDSIPMMIVRASQITNRVVLALRVHGTGPVRSDGKWLDDVTVRFDGSRISSAYGTTMGFGGKYQLAVEESTPSQLSELLRLLEDDSGGDAGLGVALRRFGFAYGRGSNEDRIVDYWVALEALFTERSERHHITAKLARRIPSVTGSTEQDQSELSTEVRELYEMRSDVVHGAEVNPDSLRLHTEKSAELVRGAILSRLRNHWTARELDTRSLV